MSAYLNTVGQPGYDGQGRPGYQVAMLAGLTAETTRDVGWLRVTPGMERAAGVQYGEREPAYQTCSQCLRIRWGSRSAARRDGHWEPFSTRTQRDLDEGPLVCAGCVGLAIEGAVAALQEMGYLRKVRS